MTRYGKKMKQRPRIRKEKKQPTRERKLKNPAIQITIPWGRGASEYRPGIFTKKYFEKHNETCCADVFHALKENLARINEERVTIGDRLIRGGTYNSFAKYWHYFKLLSLIEPLDRRESAIYDFIEERQFYRLTDKSKAEVRAWEDPIIVVTCPH